MKSLPNDIKIKFLHMLIEKQSVLDFEKWVYESNELKTAISDDDYLDLISLNYKASGAYYELIKLLEKYISRAKFQKWKLLEELNNVKLKKSNYYLTIVNFYDLYCKGYAFMDNLAFKYGLRADNQYGDIDVTSHKKPSQKQLDAIVNKFYPEINMDIDQVINWINDGKIVFKDNLDEFDYHDYDDFRTPEERKTTKNSKEVKIKQKWWKIW